MLTKAIPLVFMQKPAGWAILYVLFSFAFIRGRCQSAEVDDGCAAGAACAKKGRAMLQKKNLKTLETTTAHHDSHMHLSESQPSDYSYTLVYQDKRCHPTHWSQPREWGNLGTGLTEQQCQNSCSASDDCKWVTFKDGQCTSYTACETIQENTAAIGHLTWRKDEVTPPPPTGGTSYTLVYQDKRCHPTHWSEPREWGNLGTGLTEQQCQNACTASDDCKWVTFKAGRCTSYTACETVQENTGSIGHLTWRKDEGAVVYTLVYQDKRCHPTHWSEPREWGNLGTDLTEQQCQNACTASDDCKWVTFKDGRCTSYTACETVQENTGSIGHLTWRKDEGAVVPPTPPPPSGGTSYTLVYQDKRCHPTHWSEPREWGNLGTDLTEQQCQNRCTASDDCKWVTFKDGRCTSYTACETVQENTAAIGHLTWRKDEGAVVPPTPLPPDSSTCLTACLNQRSTLALRSFTESDDDIHAESSQLSALEMNATGGQEPGAIFMTRERLCALRCTPTTGATRKRGLGLRAGEDRRRGRVRDGAIIQCTDAAALGLDDSWFYSWGAEDSVGGTLTRPTLCAREQTRIAREFVPMVLNCNVVDRIWQNMATYKIAWEALGAKFLLGYNEPDGSHQSCSPRWGAQQWVTVQRIANSFDPPLRLVSPSPCSGSGNSCPGGGFAFGNSPWLTAFFEECEAIPECNPDMIEMIGFHDYEGDFDIREDNYKIRIENAASNYRFANGMKRHIWVTEVNVACGLTSLCRDPINAEQKIYKDGNTGWPANADAGVSQEEHLWYQQQIIPFMENSEDVFRYTWFGVRTNASFSGYPNLLPWDDENDDTPSLLGEYYMTAPEGR